MEDQPEIESNEPLYNCSECSSPIEIINIDNKDIEFKCYNEMEAHKKIIPLNEYINKMKKLNIDKDYEKCFENEHYKKYESYCFDCKMHLCEECLKTREHFSHYKINLKEILPKKNELKILDNIINECENKKEFHNLKNVC